MERARYDLIVIGSGPAGEKGAAKAAYFGKKVALVEQAASYGGAVANTGVPGKAMRETALYLSGFQQRDLHGLNLAYDGTLPDEKLRGVHVIGDNACELIAAGLVAMTLEATCSTFIDTCFDYPSLSDLSKYAAYDAMGRIDRGDVYRPWARSPPLYSQKIC